MPGRNRSLCCKAQSSTHAHAHLTLDHPAAPGGLDWGARRCQGPSCPLCCVLRAQQPTHWRQGLPGRKRLSQQLALGDSASSSPLLPHGKAPSWPQDHSNIIFQQQPRPRWPRPSPSCSSMATVRMCRRREGCARRESSDVGRASMAGAGTQPRCSMAATAPWGRDKDMELCVQPPGSALGSPLTSSLFTLKPGALLTPATLPPVPCTVGGGCRGCSRHCLGCGLQPVLPQYLPRPGHAPTAVARAVMESQAQG